MKIIRAKDYDQMSRKAANIISAQVIMKPDCVLGLATGSSPLGIYRQLIDWYNKGDVDFRNVILLIWMNMWDWILPAIRVMCTLCTTISLIPSISARSYVYPEWKKYRHCGRMRAL